MKEPSPSICNYFVDEAGDSNLFNVYDVDDTRQTQYGVYYTQKKPLTLAALPGI